MKATSECLVASQALRYRHSPSLALSLCLSVSEIEEYSFSQPTLEQVLSTFHVVVAVFFS